MTIRIMVGHVLAELAKLPDESVHCVVTSPPYYGLRSYSTPDQIWGDDPAGCEHEWGEERFPDTRGVQIGKASSSDGRGAGRGCWCASCGAWRGSLGLEPTLDLYLTHMVEICREIRRVLRSDGTFWLNIGDSYASTGGHSAQGKSSARIGRANVDQQNAVRGFAGNCTDGLKPKDLMLVPARLAIRLQEDGWYVRSDVIWGKRAPMPESVTDRPTSAHEHVFLLSKSAKYFYDAEAVKEDSDSANSHVSPNRNPQSKDYHGGRTERMNSVSTAD